MPKYFVVREVGGEDSQPYAVVSHGKAYDGKWQRKVLFVHDWHHKENDARASAHRMEYPDNA